MEFATIASSSSGNCIFVGNGSTHILVDAGISARRIAKGVESLGQKPNKIDAVLISHEHTDHVQGLATLCRKYNLPVYASPKTWPEIAPLVPEHLRNTYTYETKIKELTVNFCALSHDAVQPVGMVFSDGRHRLGIATDTGCATPAMCRAFYGLDALIVEANYNHRMLCAGPYPQFLKKRIMNEKGHLSNEQTAQFLRLILGNNGVKIVLAHLSRKNNTPEIALQEVCYCLKMYGLGELDINVAPADSPLQLIKL